MGPTRLRGHGLQLLELLVPSVCPGCDRARPAGELLLCPACAAGLRPLHELAGIATAVAYTGTGRRLVRRFKFDGRRDALAVLLGPLSARARSLGAAGVVPLPPHPARVRERGRDPVFELARALSRECGLPLWQALSRRRPTPPQTNLSPAERRANVAGSFRARPGALSGRRAILLDDVTTTGATLAEARAELERSSDVRSVVPLALAGTPAMEEPGPAAL